MTITVTQSIPLLQLLPKSLPLENAVRLELAEGIPMMRATPMVQEQVESLLIKPEELL